MVHGLVPRLAAGEQMMMPGDVEHVFLRRREDAHPRIAQLLRDVADVLLGLIRVVEQADDPVHRAVLIGGVHHTSKPGLLRGIRCLAVEVHEQHATDLVRVVAFVRGAGDVLVAHALVVKVRLVEREAAVAVELVVTHRSHGGQVPRDGRIHLEMHLLVLIERAAVDLVAHHHREIHRSFEGLRIQRLEFRFGGAHQLLETIVRDDLVVAHHEHADMAVRCTDDGLRAEAEDLRSLAAGLYAVIVEGIGLKAGDLRGVIDVVRPQSLRRSCHDLRQLTLRGAELDASLRAASRSSR